MVEKRKVMPFAEVFEVMKPAWGLDFNIVAEYEPLLTGDVNEFFKFAGYTSQMVLKSPDVRMGFTFCEGSAYYKGLNYKIRNVKDIQICSRGVGYFLTLDTFHPSTEERMHLWAGELIARKKSLLFTNDHSNYFYAPGLTYGHFFKSEILKESASLSEVIASVRKAELKYKKLVDSSFVDFAVRKFDSLLEKKVEEAVVSL